MDRRNDAQSTCRAGVASTDITPRAPHHFPIHLSGYGSRRISETVICPIYAKALALQFDDEQGEGQIAVLLTSDLLGFSREMSENIAAQVQKKFGLARANLILNSSHNHSSPITGDLLHLYYELSDDEKAVIARYTDWLIAEIVEVIGTAMENLAPAQLWFEQGLAGFAVNRRRSRSGGRALTGIVDHDVPVLAVRDENGDLNAIVFGYACHTTSLANDLLNGDYAGWAQAELEKQFPGATALFVAGCGGDQNPLPRFTVALSQSYGHILAAAVSDVLKGAMQPVSGPLRTAWHEAQLPLSAPPTRAALEKLLAGKDGIRRREIEYQLAILERGEQLPQSCAFPIHVWRFDDALTFISLSGEPVVDYALRFKKQFGVDATWVAGYSNELLSYIPSRRVLLEGGYEGTDGMMEYGLPSPFAESVEDVIAATVQSTFNDAR